MEPKNSTALTPIEQAMAKEVAALEADLSKDPKFARWRILNSTLAELAMVRPVTPPAAPTGGAKASIPLNEMIARVVGDWNNLSMTGVAIAAIQEENRPLSTREIVDMARKRGKIIGGANPYNNMSNTLSADERFIPVATDTMRAWWLSGNPVPAGWEERK